MTLHELALERFGGLSGVKDLGLLESLLNRPRNKWLYGQDDPEPPDVFDLAASYAYGLSTGHAFSDANKRTAAWVCMVFLRAHDVSLSFFNSEAEEIFVALARGELTEKEFAAWLFNRHHES